MITIVDTAHSKVAVPCPKCNKLYQVDSADFSEANNYQVGVRCVACNTGFIAKLEPQHRDAQLRIGADDAGHGAEKTYSAKMIYELVGNAIENGYEILGETDIGDLLLECICSGSNDE